MCFFFCCFVRSHFEFLPGLIQTFLSNSNHEYYVKGSFGTSVLIQIGCLEVIHSFQDINSTSFLETLIKFLSHQCFHLSKMFCFSMHKSTDFLRLQLTVQVRTLDGPETWHMIRLRIKWLTRTLGRWFYNSELKMPNSLDTSRKINKCSQPTVLGPILTPG